MIKRILLTSLSTIIVAFSSSNIFAHSNMIPADAVKASSVISMVQSHGYRDVFDFDFYGDVYVLKAVDKDNEVVKITVNAHTNEIIRVKDTERHVKRMSHPISMLDAVRKVEWAGVTKIYDVDFEGNAYEVIGFNINQKRIEYLVDYNTGAMRRTH